VSDIIIIAGFSASGKDTLARNLEKEGCNFVISHTTRPMRPNESPGNPYYFITEKEFLEMDSRNEFIEHRKYDTLVNNIPDTWHYGVHKNSVLSDKSNVVVLDLLGTVEFLQYFGDRCITFFLNADIDTRRQRCINRGDYDEFEFNRRNKDDEEKFPQQLIEEIIQYKIDSIDPNITFATVLNILYERTLTK